MPYIDKEDREIVEFGSELAGMSGLTRFIEMLERLRSRYPNRQGIAYHPGTLNYIITRLCDFWLGDANYEKYNQVIGVLECVKQELYRRQIAPYEDKKCEENGDVYYE